MNIKSILCVSLVAITVISANTNQEGDKGIGGPVNYEFGYNVYDPDSDDMKSHHEIRDGKNVYGFYTFKEADGSIRIVKYKVGPTSGFEATVEKLKPGQKIVIRKPDQGQEPDSGQDTNYVEETAQNEINDHIIPQYVGGGSRSQYVLGIINNPLQDIPLPNNGHGQHNQGQQNYQQQDYQQAPAATPVYGRRQNGVRGGRHQNQYVAPTPRGNSGYGYGQRQVHRQPQVHYITAPAAVHGNQYPTQLPHAQNYVQRPARVRGGTRRNQGYVNAQAQIQAPQIINNEQLQNLEYIPEEESQVQAVDQGYAVREETDGPENAEGQENNADVKDEGEQEAEDSDQFEEDFKATLEDEYDDEQAEEEEVGQLEEDEGEEEYVEEATEAQPKKSA